MQIHVITKTQSGPFMFFKVDPERRLRQSLPASLGT